MAGDDTYFFNKIFSFSFFSGFDVGRLVEVSGCAMLTVMGPHFFVFFHVIQFSPSTDLNGNKTFSLINLQIFIFCSEQEIIKFNLVIINY